MIRAFEKLFQFCISNDSIHSYSHSVIYTYLYKCNRSCALILSSFVLFFSLLKQSSWLLVVLFAPIPSHFFLILFIVSLFYSSPSLVLFGEKKIPSNFSANIKIYYYNSIYFFFGLKYRKVYCEQREIEIISIFIWLLNFYTIAKYI